MRKIFSFLTAILFAASMMAADPAAAGTTLFSEDFSGYAKDAVPSGTVTTATGRVVYGDASVIYTAADGGSITKIYNENTGGGTAPEILISKNNGSLTIAGIPSGGAKEITVSWTQNKQKLKVEALGTGYSGSKEEKPANVGTNSVDITVADEADETFTLIFTCTGSSNVRVDDILVVVKTAGEASQGGETPSTIKTLYCKAAQDWWKVDGAVTGIYAFKGKAENAAWPGVRMTAVEGETDLWKADIDTALYSTVIFTRMDPANGGDWGAKTGDLAIPADKDLYTITSTSAVWGDPGVAGEWSVYGEGGDTPEPPAPVEAAYYLVGTMNSWQAAEAYKFAPAEAEGEYLLHTTLAENDEIKVIKVEGETTTWYPAEGGNYIVDALHAGEKDIYFRPAGNEAWADFGGYIWMGENQPAPVADFTNPFTLKFNGTGESGKDASAAFTADVAAIFDAASAPYVASVETATKIYAGRPIADDNSSVKFGTTSAQGAFAFTLAQAIEVDSIIVNATQYGNNAAKVTVNGTEFDLTAGNKKPQDCKITPENAVSAITIAQSGSERIYLRNVRVYPKNQGGDTPVEIVLPVVKLAGSLTSWSEPALMVNAEDSLSASVTLNLGIDNYQLKVVSDDNWLSKAGDGDLYTMHRDWNHVDHLDLINTGDNIKLITDVEGAYTFTWTYADSTLVVTFPEAPAKPNYYLIGDSAFVVDAGATADKAWTPDAIPSFQDTTVLNLKAGVDYIMRLSLEGTWENHRDFRHLTDTAAGLIELPDEYQNRSIGFRLNEAGPVTIIYIPAAEEQPEVFKLIGDFYVEPTPNYYIIGAGEAFGEWSFVPVMQDTFKLPDLAAGDYMFRVALEDGNWKNTKGYSDLTEKTEGLSANEDNNILFTLAEAGDVAVVYNDSVFRVIGNFYVAPVVEPAKFYVTGDSALVADAAGDASLAWNPAAIKAEADTLVLNLKAETDYILKVTVNGTWEGENNVKGYNELTEKTAGLKDLSNDHNIGFRLAEAGEVKVVYIAAEGENSEIFKLIGNFYVEPTPEPAKFYVTGNAALVGEELEWNPSAIKSMNDTLVLNLEAETDYVLKVTVNGTWEGENNVKGYNELTEKTAGLKDLSDDHNIGFRLAEAGEVKVVYIAAEGENSEIFKLIGNFYVDPTPVVPTAAVTGDMTEWGEPIPFELSEDSTFATLYNDNIKKGTYAFKMIINGDWRSNGYEFHRGFPGCAGISDNTDADMTVVIDVEGAYTFKWYFANDSLAIIYPEKPEPVLTNGYYLVGKFDGVDAWSVEDLSAEKLFAANTESEGEYQLSINLAVGDEVKVVYVENDAITTWFPAEGDNYTVDHNHAGPTTMYFRPEYNSEWSAFGGYFYIVPTSTVGFENTAVDAKAVKVLKNGILVIEKNNKTYNVMGQMVK